MMSLDDPKWQSLEGGYRVAYDASEPLRRLEQGEDVWDELWQELHHQGDVGEASYAAVPHLVRITEGRQPDWNLYALVAVIEVERNRRSNPPVPFWLETDYKTAWQEIKKRALQDVQSTTDPLLLRSALSVIALASGETKLGAILTWMDTSEVDEIAEQQLAWSELYSD